MLLDGIGRREIVFYACTRLPLTNEPYHLRGSLLSFTHSKSWGAFMKNKLIMHTKLHLQETFRYILQSSKMIRFTFCSRGLVTLSPGMSDTTGLVHVGPMRCWLPCMVDWQIQHPRSPTECWGLKWPNYRIQGENQRHLQAKPTPTPCHSLSISLQHVMEHHPSGPPAQLLSTEITGKWGKKTLLFQVVSLFCFVKPQRREKYSHIDC